MQEFSKVKMGSSRSFGILFAAVFLLAGVYPLLEGAPVHIWSISLAAVLFLLACCAPRVLQPLNVLWFKFGMFLAAVVSPIVMFVIYATTVLPIGLILRGLGKDLLRLKIDDADSTFWLAHVPPGPEPEALRDQF